MSELTFDQSGDFVAVDLARVWLKDHGYSCGSMCMDIKIHYHA